MAKHLNRNFSLLLLLLSIFFIALLSSFKTSQAQELTIRLNDIRTPIVPTRLLSGDREFGGNGPLIRISTAVRLDTSRRRIMATITFRANELGGDGSATSITRTVQVFPRRGQLSRQMREIIGPATSTLTFLDTSRPTPFRLRPSPGGLEDGARLIRVGPTTGRLVRQFRFIGDTHGDDISTDQNPHGDTSLRAILFNPIRVLF